MAKKYYKDFAVTGVINSTVYDAPGLSSPEGEKRTLKAILINVSAYAGNLVEGWLEREKMLSIRDRVFNTSAETAAQAPFSATKIVRLEMDYEIPIGQTFTLAINSGGVATNLEGAYEYEIS